MLTDLHHSDHEVKKGIPEGGAGFKCYGKRSVDLVRVSSDCVDHLACDSEDCSHETVCTIQAGKQQNVSTHSRPQCAGGSSRDLVACDTLLPLDVKDGEVF